MSDKVEDRSSELARRIGEAMPVALPVYTAPRRPMEVESYRQEQLFRGKHEALTQGERDAARQTHQRPDAVGNERTDHRQMEMQLQKSARGIER